DDGPLTPGWPTAASRRFISGQSYFGRYNVLDARPRPPLDCRHGKTEETIMEMTDHTRGKQRVGLLTVAIALAFAVIAPAAWSEVPVRFVRLDGFAAPGTPPELDKVGVLQIGRKNARNILILNPGTSASAAYFAPMAKT